MVNDTLYITDLDGTLLNDESRVSLESARILSRLSREGCMITVATARTPATVEPLLKHVVTRVPAVVSTGAALWDRKARRFLDVHYLGAGLSRAVVEECRRGGLTPFCYNYDPDGIIRAYFSGRPERREQKFIDERSGLPLKRMYAVDGPSPSTAGAATAVQIFAMGDLERVRVVADRLRGRGDCAVSFYPDIFNPLTGFLEVFALGVSKASAIRRLRELTGARRTVVFGDSSNDLPMMREADVSVAVSNAIDEVKQAADMVIGPNTADSVARCIEMMCGAEG